MNFAKTKDRFIGRLSEFDFYCPDAAKLQLPLGSPSKCINLKKLEWTRKKHILNLRSVLDPCRSTNPKQQIERDYLSQSAHPAWPLKPRRFPCLDPPYHVVNFCLGEDQAAPSSMASNCVDWNGSDKIAVIILNRLWIKALDKTAEFCIYENEEVKLMKSLKWSPDGEHLAVKLLNYKICVVNAKSMKAVAISSCCSSFQCPRTIFEWASADRLLTGCKDGLICVLNKNLEILSSISQFLFKEIVNLKASCNSELLAVHLGTKRLHFTAITSEAETEKFFLRRVKSFAWHPWRHLLLAYADSAGAVFLLNLANLQTVLVYKVGDSHVDDVVFNPFSAELVVGRRTEAEGSVLEVLCGVDQVVECLTNVHCSNIHRIMFSSDGAKMATVASDENINFFRFFGSKKENKQKCGSSDSFAVFRSYVR